jgi:hypothetical protein
LQFYFKIFFIGKQEFDLKINEFNAKINSCELDYNFNLDAVINNHSNNSDENQIDCINYCKFHTKYGQLKYKLHLELIFFTNLKCLRLNYTNKLNEINKKKASIGKNDPLNQFKQLKEENELKNTFFNGDELSIDSAITSSENLTNNSSVLNRISKERLLNKTAALSTNLIDTDKKRKHDSLKPHRTDSKSSNNIWSKSKDRKINSSNKFKCTVNSLECKTECFAKFYKQKSTSDIDLQVSSRKRRYFEQIILKKIKI